MQIKEQQLSIKVDLDTTAAKEKIKELIDMLEHANQLFSKLDNN